jgi:hypothetical protein
MKNYKNFLAYFAHCRNQALIKSMLTKINPNLYLVITDVGKIIDKRKKK